MNRIQIGYNKRLRMSNVVERVIEKDEFGEFEKIVEQMEGYIRSKGTVPLGPLIQYTEANVNENGIVDMAIKLMRQCNSYIHNVELPYKTQSLIRITNCIYCRYIGPEEKINFAYDKINITAFEEDILLKGNAYTIFVGEEDDSMVADIFMERAGG
ncbi:hypothetical protein LQZ18_18545 [Lachnospiraceae bacterium ZAX-1]